MPGGPLEHRARPPGRRSGPGGRPREVPAPERAATVPRVSSSLYERVGGQAWFDRLVDRFYDGVEHDPILRPMYPDDLAAPKRHLALFLGQYWGGPGTYSVERGHPRLRMRHVPFVVDHAARDAWLTHMEAALAAEPPDEEATAELLAYLRKAADFLVNHPG